MEEVEVVEWERLLERAMVGRWFSPRTASSHSRRKALRLP